METSSNAGRIIAGVLVVCFILFVMLKWALIIGAVILLALVLAIFSLVRKN